MYMYSKVRNCVKTATCNRLIDSFLIPVETRQGCNLSPSLFNCFINDLPDTLEKLSCNEPFLLNRKLSCLLYADDLILFSKWFTKTNLSYRNIL